MSAPKVTLRDIISAAIVLVSVVLSIPLIVLRLLWRQSEITADAIANWLDDWASS